MTTKMQQETPSQAVVITKENVAQTKRPDSHRNQWVQTEPREKTEEQQKVGALRRRKKGVLHLFETRGTLIRLFLGSIG